MKIVHKGAPVRIMGAACANEAHDVRAIDGQLDELVLRGATEPLAPGTQSFLREISVKKRVEEGASIVLTPAACVERSDSLRVFRYCRPILDHPQVLLPDERPVLLRPFGSKVLCGHTVGQCRAEVRRMRQLPSMKRPGEFDRHGLGLPRSGAAVRSAVHPITCSGGRARVVP
jgi:hypothetical protein